MIMKFIPPLCMMLALSIPAYGQQPGTSPLLAMPGEPQPDPTGRRLQYLLKTVYELEQAGNVQQAAKVRRQADEERQSLLRRLDALQAEIDLIRQATNSGAQVMVHIQIFEVSISKLRRLGFDSTKLSGDSATKSNIEAAANAQSFSVIDDGAPVQQLLETLRKDNLAKVLAEPTLVTLSGRTAVFHAGSELSIPKPQPDGSTAIEHRYGTEVELTPEALGDKVHLAFHGRLSEQDYAHTVQVGKETIPGVRVSECCTRAELKSSQTLVIRGPTQMHTETEASGPPYISSIPYVGAAFRSVKETHNELATFILVRPEIVQTPPVSAYPNAGAQGDPSAPRAVQSGYSPGAAYPTITRRTSQGDARR
jgi:Flp pilus assembly secretin CpaC